MQRGEGGGEGGVSVIGREGGGGGEKMVVWNGEQQGEDIAGDVGWRGGEG